MAGSDHLNVDPPLNLAGSAPVLTVSNVNEEILVNSHQVWYSTSEHSTRCRCCSKVCVMQSNGTRVPSSGKWNNS